MAAPRLPFLWPMLWKEASRPAIRTVARTTRRRLHQSTSTPQQETVPQRYGTANQPPAHLGGGKSFGPPTTSAPAARDAKALPKIGTQLQKDGEKAAPDEMETRSIELERRVAEDRQAAERKERKTEPTTIETDAKVAILDATESMPKKDPPGALDRPSEKPMDSLLDSLPNLPAQKEDSLKSSETSEESFPASDEQSQMHPPHLNTPRYVHHFDTYSLVQRLVEGGWSEEQAVTIMKAVRLILADNMDLARDGLVSKSNVENETYLFRAACSELKTEVNARRKGEQEKMRTERTQLQHEVDILSQRMSQESGSLKDELKGMFDDRKMAVRNEQRGTESKVQELNYKITVSLNADSRSEVEGLRWVMTRRTITALAVMVLMIVGSLKLYSNEIHRQEMDRKRIANMKSGGTQTEEGSPGGEFSGSGGEGSGSTEARVGLGGGEMLVKEGDNPAFVSLG